MRYAIISDIHSNLEALQAVIHACRDDGARRIYCVGDIVGYGSNPNECVELVQKEIDQTVAGNHDWAVSGKIDLKNFNEVAKSAVLWTQKNIADEHCRYLNNLELTFKNEDLIMVHGTLNKPAAFQYLIDTNQSLDTFFMMDRQVCFVGHSHIPQIFVKNSDRIDFVQSMEVYCEKENKYIVNVGSVGQPRDGNPQATYCIFDPDLNRIQIKRVPYDIESAMKRIVMAGLPEMLGKRLTVGQ